MSTALAGASTLGSRHRHSCAQPHISPGLPQHLCPFAARPEGTKNKAWGFPAQRVPGAGGCSLGQSRKGTHPQDPCGPCTWPGLPCSFFSIRASCCPPGQGLLGVTSAPSDSSDGRGCFSVPREEQEPFWQLYKHTSSRTCSSQERQNVPTWKGKLLGLTGRMKIISMRCLVSASLWVQANQIQVQVGICTGREALAGPQARLLPTKSSGFGTVA